MTEKRTATRPAAADVADFQAAIYQEPAPGFEFPDDRCGIPDAYLYEHLRDEHGWNVSGWDPDDFATLRAAHRIAIEQAPPGTPPEPEHQSPGQEPAICWFTDMRRYGVETANQLHPIGK